MLSKKFQLIKNEIEAGNYALANKLLNEVSRESLSDNSSALYSALSSRLPKAVGVEKETQQQYVEASLLSDFDVLSVKNGISIVSCCMNRNENLLKALKTWVKLPVDEIIIVDWSSDVPVSESINEVDDPRIKILRVEGEKKWVLTYGFNVGLRFASYSKVFKFDADIEVSEDFLQLNSIGLQQFVRGYWKSALDQGLDSQVYVNGSFGAHKKHLKKIGYYNELIRTYGWDDSDLYERLASQCGLETTFLDFKSVMHMEQEESERTAHQDVVTANYLGVVPTTDFNNQRNKFIGRTTDYWDVSRLQNYTVEHAVSNIWKLRRVSESIHIPQYITDDANTYAAIHFLWAHQHHLVAKAHSQTKLARFLFKEYQAEVNFEITQEFLGELSTDHVVKYFNESNQSFENFLKDCLVTAQREEVPVYGVALGDSYAHKRLGDIGSFVEVLTLTNEFVDVIEHQRAVNGISNSVNGLVSFVNPHLFEQVNKNMFKPKVYVDAQHGLGNRIRAIGSAAAIAKKTNRELVIVWQSDHHCECEFNDLFDYSGLVIEKSFVQYADKYMDLYNYMEVESGACKDKFIKVSEDKHLYLRSAYTFNSPLSDWESENQFIRSLKPTDEILSLIGKFDLSDAIAAHVRMEAGAGLDHNTYDSVENWTQKGHQQLHFWREKSHYSHFMKRIDELFVKDKGAKLFLATDLPETYKVFEECYGERLVYLKRGVYDRSKEQIKYALADALLLSKAKKLLGSTWSSFSELAMRLSKTYTEIEMSGKEF